MCKVLNAKKVGKCVEGAVYIGRPSKWGNPFVIGKDGTRAQVIQKYREWIKTQPHLLASLQELVNKDLICWCAPLACHGDVLRELVESYVLTHDARFHCT